MFSKPLEKDLKQCAKYKMYTTIHISIDFINLLYYTLENNILGISIDFLVWYKKCIISILKNKFSDCTLLLFII